MENLPQNWFITTLQDIAQINPTLDKSRFSDDVEVSFVPMPAVDAERGMIDASQIRKFGEVKKGYTPFRKDDVLFAKITPCMENGKMAVAPELHNQIGFGSTEFHVIRAYQGIEPRWLYYFISSKRFRSDAEHNMTGAVGQKRVPTAYMEQSSIPLPPTNEQKRIVAKIEELFSELDKGIESLKTTREQLKVYRQAVLKHAFEGKLTARWRGQNQDKLETADQLLERINQQREAYYQQQLSEYEDEIKIWNADGKEGVCPKKPKRLEPIVAPSSERTLGLPELPNGWQWAPLSWLLSLYKKPMTTGPFGTMLSKNEHTTSGIPVLGIENIGKGKFLYGNKIFVTEQKAQELRAFEVEATDVIISRSGTVGEICEVPSNLGKALISTNLLRIALNHDVIISYFFVLLFHGAVAVKKQIKELCKGSSRDFLNQSILSSLFFPLPSPDEQDAVLKQIDSRFSLIEKLEGEMENALQQSEALRQSILKKAFSAKLVAQDPNDEPASVLLERIRAEKGNQSGKKQPKQKPDADSVFELAAIQREVVQTSLF